MSYRYNLFLSLLLGIGLVMGMVPVMAAEEKASEYAEDEEQANIAVQAANSLTEQMEQDAKKQIPESVLASAKCIGVFPSVTEFGFVLAGKGGLGIVSCRDEQSGEWGSTAIYNLSAVSVGLQAGMQTESIVLVYLQDEAVQALKEPKMTFGAGIGIQAGPVGTELDTEKLKKTAVASYARAKGLFAGVNLEGAKLKFVEGRTAKYYGGEEMTSEQALFGGKPVPEKAAPFIESLMKFAPAAESSGS
jgi:lipid-binding SYLF domain-containing protein